MTSPTCFRGALEVLSIGFEEGGNSSWVFHGNFRGLGGSLWWGGISVEKECGQYWEGSGIKDEN